MDKNNPMLFKDGNKSLWEFHLSEDNCLVYSTVSEGGKHMEGGKIDTEVSEFAAGIDQKGVLHFVYIKERSLKYCKLESGSWLSKTIYEFEDDIIVLQELGLCLSGNNANIFHVLQKNTGNSNLGTIRHLLWDGENLSINVISNINLLQDGISTYQAETLSNGGILLLFISNDGSEVQFRSCMYVNSVFSGIGLLYALKGNSIDFHMVRCVNEYHFLNLSRNHQNHILEDVCIEAPGKIKSIAKLYECTGPISDSLLFLDKNTLKAFWKAESKVYYSSLADGWSAPRELCIDTGANIRKYHYIDNDGDRCPGVKKVLGSAFPDLRLILPDNLKEYMGDTTETDKNEKEHTNVIEPPDIDTEPENLEQTTQKMASFDRRSPGEYWRGIMELSKKEWQQAMGKTDYRPSYKSVYGSELPPLSPQINKGGEWSREMFQNSAILAREKLNLEGKYTQLLMDKLSLEEETAKLKEMLKGAEDREESFEEEMHKMETMLKEISEENEKLKNDLAAERNKGLLDVIFKRSKAQTHS